MCPYYGLCGTVRVCGVGHVGGVCVRSCQQNEQLGLYGTVKAMWLDRYVPSYLVGALVGFMEGEIKLTDWR